MKPIKIGENVYSIGRPLAPGFELINGVEMNKEHPDTFELPSKAQREDIPPGTFVMVGVRGPNAGEHFWVEIRSRVGDEAGYLARVDNRLFEEFGWKFDDIVHVGPENILAILVGIKNRNSIGRFA